MKIKNVKLSQDKDALANEITFAINSAKQNHLKSAFEHVFKKPLEVDKIAKDELVRYVNQDTEWWCYLDRVFLIVHELIYTENLSWKMIFETPTDLYAECKNNKVTFTRKSI